MIILAKVGRLLVVQLRDPVCFLGTQAVFKTSPTHFTHINMVPVVETLAPARIKVRKIPMNQLSVNTQRVLRHPTATYLFPVLTVARTNVTQLVTQLLKTKKHLLVSGHLMPLQMEQQDSALVTKPHVKGKRNLNAQQLIGQAQPLVVGRHTYCQCKNMEHLSRQNLEPLIVLVLLLFNS